MIVTTSERGQAIAALQIEVNSLSAKAAGITLRQQDIINTAATELGAMSLQHEAVILKQIALQDAIEKLLEGVI